MDEADTLHAHTAERVAVLVAMQGSKQGGALTHHTPDAQTSYLQQQLVTLNQEKQYMESRFTRLTSKGPLKTGEERREKLDLERRLDQVAKQIASLRREVRRLEGNSLNPKP